MNADKFRQERAIETIPMIEIGKLAFAISRRFFAVGCIAWLDSDDLIETLNDLRNLLG